MAHVTLAASCCLAALSLTAGKEAHPAPRGPRAEVARLVGLERLYFERSDDPGAESSLHADEVRRVLPEVLPAERPFDGDPNAVGEQGESRSPAELLVRDFRLPRPKPAGEWLLRQVLDRHSRLTEQWWCPYLEGRRGECWFFAPSPARTENKLLAEYELREIQTPTPDRVVLRVCGAMYRPQGAWWGHGKDLAFTVDGAGLTLDRVWTPFYFSRGYDLGEAPPLQLFTETPLPDGSGYERRDLDSVSDAEQKRCGFRDPLADADGPSCSELERAARCLAASGGRVTRRGRDERSFAERGGPQAR